MEFTLKRKSKLKFWLIICPIFILTMIELWGKLKKINIYLSIVINIYMAFHLIIIIKKQKNNSIQLLKINDFKFDFIDWNGGDFSLEKEDIIKVTKSIWIWRGRITLHSNKGRIFLDKDLFTKEDYLIMGKLISANYKIEKSFF